MFPSNGDWIPYGRCVLKKAHFTVPLTRRCKSAGFGQEEEMLRIVGHVVTESCMVRCRKMPNGLVPLSSNFDLHPN